MPETRIDTPDPLVNLEAIEQRVGRRRLTWAGILGGLNPIPHIDHVSLSSSTLSLGHPGLVLTSVTVSPTTATFSQTGQVQQLSAIALDQNKTPLVVQPPINWASSNPAVATVSSNGLVTAQSTNGVTTVSAFVVGQPNFFANAAVTLSLQSVTVNHVTVSPSTLTLLHTVVGSQIPQVVTVSPQNVSVPLGNTQNMSAVIKTATGTTLSGFTPTWESSNQAVATVNSSGVVTPVAQGTATIYASVIDQGQTLNTYANQKGIRHGYSTNYHYRGELPYSAQYPKVFSDLAGGIATEETAFNIYNLTTSASTPGNIAWNQAQLATCDQQIADWNTAGARPLLYLLNGDAANGEPSWYSLITSPALATQALNGILDFTMARWGASIWGVVLFNECIKTFGQQPNGYQTNTFLTQMGQSFLATGATPGFFAYAAARIKADAPNVQVWMNCNHCETDSAADTANWANILTALTGLQQYLSGFRFEMHQNLSLGSTVYTKFQSRCQAIKNLGLNYAIGELDHPDDILLGSGPSGVWQRDETGASIRATLHTAMAAVSGPPDHVMEWQDSSQTSWLSSPPEAGVGGNIPGSTPYERQAHTTDGDSFTVSGQTFYTHQVVPNTGALGQTASGNALSVMVTPAVGTALSSGAAVTYTKGLTGGTLAQTGGITLSANVASGAFVLPLKATTLTGTTIEGTHARPNSRDENYVATPNYRAHLQAYGGPVGSSLITVVPAGPPPGGAGPNAPSGLNVFVNTGNITTPPSQAFNGTWSAGGAIFTNLSPNTKSSTGEWAGNLALDPSGVGWMITYDPSLQIGNSPVRYQTPLSLALTPTGLFYSYRTIVFSSNFDERAGTGMKLYEPRTAYQGNGQGSTTNMVGSAAWGTTNNSTQLQAGFFLQGPNGQSLPILPTSPTVGLVTGGAPHTVEEIWQQDQPAGTGNASVKLWVDGVLVINRTGLTMMASGMTNYGWNSWLTDPTYGGATGSNPPFAMTWTTKSLFLAGK